MSERPSSGLVDRAIHAPISVAVGVILILLFGFISLVRVPIQLTPDVDQPRITVETRWPGASPVEVEREIVDKQEKQLKSIEGLTRMTSESQDSSASVVLEFGIGTDIDASMLRVANKLEQVQEKPALADQPTISNVDARSGAITWIVLKRLPGNDRPIETYRDLCEDEIQPALERVEGVARSFLFGGTERELQVTVDPRKLSAFQLTADDLVSALRRENQNISAGDFDEGKRRYVVRTVGEFSSPEDVNNIVVAQRGGQVVYLKDIGEAKLGYAENKVAVRQRGEPALAMNCQRASGANVLETMAGIRQTIARLNAEILPSFGVELEQVYDETVYIDSALNLVIQNILVGGLLAIAVLLLFLRSRSSIFIIATAIPISIVGTFLALYALGRNLNVVSLAGMSFAVGMVVDNAIVVLENIYRHRQMGKSRLEAALTGANEVKGAVLASTLTTMAVFVPILFMQEEVGQLYRDIALAISSAVALSMLVSLTVIPTLSAKMIGGKALHKDGDLEDMKGLRHRGLVFTNWLADTVYRLCGKTSTRLGIAIGLTLLAVVISRLLLPPAEYLPTGNRNLIFGIMLPPPGYNMEELAKVGDYIEETVKPHLASYRGVPNPERADPAIDNFFYVAFGRQAFMGATCEEQGRARELIPLLQKPLFNVPGLIPILVQPGLFAQEIGQGRSVELEITGPDLDRLVELAQGAFFRCLKLFPGAQMRPIPSLDLGNPEVNITPNRVMLSKLGLTTEQVGTTVDMFLDGRKVDDYPYQGEEIDLVVRGIDAITNRSQDFANLPIITPEGKLVTLGSIADITVTTGPEQVNHIERRRAISISIVPPEELPLETVMQQIRASIIDPMKASGDIGGIYQMKLSGTADDLEVTAKAVRWNLILAVIISFLLMAALFESFLYPLVIMFSVPLAAVGGFMGLRLMNLFSLQPMDTLTMLGFFILIGTVVNNAILIVYQALNLIRGEAMVPREAIRESVRTRVRPIFMSTMTSVLGMAPLVFFPGAGSELYRGIGSVVIGGLIVSTLFTLVLVPTLFSLVYEVQMKVMHRFNRHVGE